MFRRNGTIDVHEFSALWKYIQDWKACFDRWVSQFRYSVLPASSLYSYRYFMSHFWMIDFCNFTEHSVTFSGSTPIDQETSTLPSFALHFTVSATTCKSFCFLLREGEWGSAHYNYYVIESWCFCFEVGHVLWVVCARVWQAYHTHDEFRRLHSVLRHAAHTHRTVPAKRYATEWHHLHSIRRGLHTILSVPLSKVHLKVSPHCYSWPQDRLEGPISFHCFLNG